MQKDYIKNLEMENDMLKCYEDINLTGTQGGWGGERPGAIAWVKGQEYSLREGGRA